MVDITLFELHFPEAEFNAPFAGSPSPATESGSAESAMASASGASEDDSSGSKIAPLMVVAALVGIVMVARYLRGGETGPEPLDEVEA